MVCGQKEVAEDGTCSLTGLLDPDNMHAGDPLMDFARLDAFSMHGDATKMARGLALAPPALPHRARPGAPQLVHHQRGDKPAARPRP